MSRHGLTVDHALLQPDHALMVARGVLDRTTVAHLADGVEQVLETGTRYLVLVLAQVTRCDKAALAELAEAARRLSRRGGWLRLVATSPAVVDALDHAALPDLVSIYHAHNGSTAAAVGEPAAIR